MVARTVKVGLDVDEKPFTRGVEQAEKAAEKLADALDDVTGSAKDTAASTDRATESTEDLGDSAKDAGQDLNRLRADAQKLDKQIDETARSIRDLAREIAAASDEATRADLSKKLSVEQVKQQKQVSLRKLIDVDSASDVGAEMAEKVSVSFGTSLVKSVGRNSPMLARALTVAMNPAVAAIGAPLAIGVATLLGTAAAGAIIGGVGIGGVVGGIALAAKDPEVKAAGTELGKDLSDMLGRASVAFVPETLDAIDTIRDRALEMEPAFTRVFGSASRLLDPLLDGLLDAGENVLPGVIDVLDAAPPVIDSIADGLRGIGDAVGDSLSDLAPHADEGARALGVLFTTVEYGIRVTSHVVEQLALLYGTAEKVSALATGDLPLFYSLITEDGANAADTSGDLADGLGGVGRAAGRAASKALDLVDALQILNGLQLTTNEAERAFQRAIDDAREAFDGKTRDFKGATEKGREYGEALDRIATSAKTSGQAIFDQTGDVALANAKINEGRTALYNQARQYGRTETEAWAYVDSVLSIPKKWDTKVTAETTQAEANLAAVKALIARIQSKRVVITTQHNQIVTRSEGRNVPIGDGIGGRRWGGITEHAQWGVLREAQIAAPVAPARYAWAEPATGGEAFIPRFGDRDRSLDILSRAAKWYGQQVVPAGGGGGQVAAPAVGPQQLARMIRSALVGVTVQMDGRTVGAIQGREADLYARGV